MPVKGLLGKQDREQDGFKKRSGGDDTTGNFSRGSLQTLKNGSDFLLGIKNLLLPIRSWSRTTISLPTWQGKTIRIWLLWPNCRRPTSRSMFVAPHRKSVSTAGRFIR